MVAYKKLQQRMKEENERLRGERYQINFIDLRFERWQVVGPRKARRKQNAPKIACSWEEGEKLRGERDKIKFIDLRFERWQVVGLRKARRRQEVCRKVFVNLKAKTTGDFNLRCQKPL